MTDERVALRPVLDEDLPIFFEHQRDPKANAMAAFPARDRPTFMAHWARSLRDERNLLRAIVFDGQVAGNIVSWMGEGERDLGYWIGREFWGQGIATQALRAFLLVDRVRPLHAHVAVHNLGSLRVLEKCGFQRAGEHLVPASEPGGPVKEFVLMLPAGPD